MRLEPHVTDSRSLRDVVVVDQRPGDGARARRGSPAVASCLSWVCLRCGQPPDPGRGAARRSPLAAAPAGPAGRGPPAVHPQGAAGEPAAPRGRTAGHGRAGRGGAALGPDRRAAQRGRPAPDPGVPARHQRGARPGRPGRHARRAGRPGRGPAVGEPGHPRRARRRPLRHRRRLRPPGRPGPQRRAGVRPQRRALPLPQVGPGHPGQVPDRPSRHGDHAPGQHRVPGPGGGDRRRLGLPGRVLGHRLAHHHGQRPRRPRLGDRRHRGRGHHAGPVVLAGRAAGGGLPAHRGAAARGHGHRPGAHHHRAAARPRRGRQVRRVPRPRG
jgi:hypothetical protein